MFTTVSVKFVIGNINLIFLLLGEMDDLFVGLMGRRSSDSGECYRWMGEITRALLAVSAVHVPPFSSEKQYGTYNFCSGNETFSLLP